MRILVAEDDDTSALLIGRMLRRAGYDYDRARDGIEALQLIESGQSYGVVLSDWAMPRLDGLSLIGRLRKTLSPVPPMIVLTATASDEARNMVLDAGADDYLAKPIRGTELGKCIERALQRATQRSTLHSLPAPEPSAPGGDTPVVMFAAGTGGPVALGKVFSQLSRGDVACFIVVQHGPTWMLETFGHRLQTLTRMTVDIAADGTPIRPGTVLIVPADVDATFSPDGRTLSLREVGGDAVRSTADVLFSSAVVLGHQAIACVLTGTGCDGTAGAARLAAVGATVLAQDPSSCEVSSMPQNVISEGFGPRVLPLDKVSRFLDDLLRRMACAA